MHAGQTDQPPAEVLEDGPWIDVWDDDLLRHDTLWRHGEGCVRAVLLAQRGTRDNFSEIAWPILTAGGISPL